MIYIFVQTKSPGSNFDYNCPMIRLNYYHLLIGLFLICIFQQGCNKSEGTLDHSANARLVPITLDYAKGFTITRLENITLVTINSAGIGGSDSLTYALIPIGMDKPKYLQVDQEIPVPVESIVVTSTSHLPFLDLLGVSDRLVGFPNTNFVSSEIIRSRIEQGLIKEVGTANGLDLELLIELQPELVMSYFSGPDRGELDLLDKSSIPVVLNVDFKEASPLGRAEWIKFMGLIVGKYQEADSVFDQIEQEYQKLTRLTREVRDKPSVFSGILYGDSWFAPGGKSFVARFIEDAGGIYTWTDYSSVGSVELSFESVLERNATTDFWIGAGGFSSKESLRAADHRYTNFYAFETGDVYNYHGRIGATGGFEYLESGGARPDLVLADFIKILHGELLPEYQPYYFKKLE